MSDFKYENQNQKEDDEDKQHELELKQEVISNKPEQNLSQSQHLPSTKNITPKIETIHKAVSKKIQSDHSRVNRLVDEHIEIKSQLIQLAIKMDEIIENNRVKKNNKKNNLKIQEDEEVKQLKQQLKQQQIKMHKKQIQTNKLRKNLDNNYDIIKINDKENQLKFLQAQWKKKQDQKISLEQIKKSQERALENGQYRELGNRIDRMKEQLRQIMKITKKQTLDISTKQKQLRLLHEKLIIKEQKIKDIQFKIRNGKKLELQQINEEKILQLEDQIKTLETEKDKAQKYGNQRLKVLQQEKRQWNKQYEKKKLILEEKRKDLNLSEKKNKDILKLINKKANPAQHQKSVQENKTREQKRVISKKGRDAPIMDEIQVKQEQNSQKRIDTPQDKISDKNIAEENDSPRSIGEDSKLLEEYGVEADFEDIIEDN